MCLVDGSYVIRVTLDVPLFAQMIITSCMVDYTHLAPQSIRSVVQHRARGQRRCYRVTADWIQTMRFLPMLNHKSDHEANLLTTELH